MARVYALLFLCLAVDFEVDAQVVEIDRNGTTRRGVYHAWRRSTALTAPETEASQRGIELFARQGAELTFRGSGQAIVQIVKLHVGEPDGFNLPLYFFLSPTGDVLGGDQKVNEPTAASLVNPLGGSVNLTVAKDHRLFGKHDEFTSVKLAYQASGKLLSGSKLPAPTEHLATVVGYGDIGLMFQTGAWREDEKGNVGVLWIQAKVGGSLGSKENLTQLFGPEVAGTVPHWSIYGGIDINGYLNLKLGVAQAFGSKRAPVFEKPFIKFAFDVVPGSRRGT